MHKKIERGAPAPGILIAAAILIATAHTQAQEKKLPLSLDMRWNTYSAYVWRGKVLDRGATTQPSVIGTLNMKEYGSFSMKVWSNWDLSQKKANPKAIKSNGGLNVLNYTPSYHNNFGPIGFTIGNIWYTFYPRTVNTTRELFTTLAYHNSVVTPSITAYYDYWEVGDGFLKKNPSKSTYFRTALDKSIAVREKLSLSGTALLGVAGGDYNKVRYKSPDGEGFVDYEFSTTLTYAVNEHFSIGGKMAFTGLIGGAYGLNRHNISPDEIFWGGINLRCVF